MRTIKVLSEVPQGIIVDFKQTLKHKGTLKPYAKLAESDGTAIVFYSEKDIQAYSQFKKEVA